MLGALIPISLLESVVFIVWLRARPAAALRAGFLANGASTLAGVPIAIILTTLIEPVATRLFPMASDGRSHWFREAVLEAPLLRLPHEDMSFTVPVASYALLTLLFVVTVFIETWVGRRALPAANPRQRWRAILVGNGLSYTALAALVSFAVFRPQ